MSKLKAFGSIAWVTIPTEPEHQHKLLGRAWKGILVGYEGSGYRIWDPTKRQVVVSNHVKAHENELGSDWLKELSMPLPPAPRNHESADVNNDLVLLGDTIIVAPPIEEPVSPGLEQQILAKDKAATKAANNCASNDPAVQEPTT